MRKIISLVLALVLAFALCACDKAEQVTVSVPQNDDFSVSDKVYSESENSVTVREDVLGSLKKSDLYKDYLTDKSYVAVNCKDKTATAASDSVIISDGNICITTEGVYCLSGDFEGNVIVDADENAKIVLVLNNVKITSGSGAAVYVKKADKVTVMLPENTVNSLSDAKTRTAEEEEVTACLFSKASLAIAGEGTLKVTGCYKDGITSRDNLVITGGNIKLAAEDDGIVGRDSLVITEGSFEITAKGHGLKTTNDSKEDKGAAYIVGGSFDIEAGTDGINVVSDLIFEEAMAVISAGDDGIHADKSITVNSGTINIVKSNEGIEAKIITLNGGDVSVISSDDGVNANGKEVMGFGGFFGRSEDNSTSEETCIYINGGHLKVNAYGDGLDSNGDIIMTGGVVYVSGPEGDMNNATDYANTFVVTGGIIIATGSSGMYQSISEGSSCGSIDYITSSGIAAGTKCSLAQNGVTLLTFEAEKRCAAILIAGEGIAADNDYTLTIGDSSETVTANKGGSYQGFSFGGPGGGSFGGGMGPRGEKDFEGMMPPNGSDFEGVMPPDGSGFDGMTPPDGDEFKGNPYGSKPEKDKKSDKNNGL